MATAVSASATNNPEIDGLLGGTKWSGTITYSFPDSSSDYIGGYGDGEPVAAGFSQAPLAIQQAITYAFALIADYTNASIQFAGTNGADIAVAQSSAANPTAYAYYPSNNPTGGDVWFGNAYNYSLAALGNYYFTTALHELGHALGLKHSQETGGVANVAVPAAHDNSEFTVMSYRSYAGGPLTGYTNEAYGYSQTYMANDILALQTLYGADFTTHQENTVYSWSSTTGQQFINGVAQLAPGGGAGGSANRIFETIWDGSGIDTYDLSNYTTAVSINLNPGASSVTSAAQIAYLGNGHYAAGNIYNAYLYNNDVRSYIDNAIGGSGNDTLIGNAIANNLSGGGGNDRLTGGAGNDTIVGGSGTDVAVFSGAHTSYLISYNSTTQTFTVADQRSGSPDGTDTVSGVENFQFSDGTVASSGLTTPSYNLQPSGLGWQVAITQDFNSDGHDDVLWINPSAGTASITYLSNGTVASQSSFATPGVGWTLIGHGDYNGDGNIDLLWQNASTSQAIETLLAAGQITATLNFGVMGPEWKLISSGDFNADGTDDMLWRNTTTGQGLEWFLDQGHATSWLMVGTMGLEWKVASTIDLNHEGTADILWQNSNSGEGVEWFTQNGYATSWQRFGTMGPGWDVVATADFNNDSNIDLLWQDQSTGRIVEWFINDSGHAFDWKDLGTPGSAWKVAGLLDVHDPVGPTILLQNAAIGSTILLAAGASTAPQLSSVLEMGGNNASAQVQSTVHAVAAPVAMSSVTSAAGNNIIMGTAAGDTFLFAQNLGQDVTRNFELDNDLVRIDHSMFADLSALMAHISDDQAGNAVIALSAKTTLTLEGISTDSLQNHLDHFIIS